MHSGPTVISSREQGGPEVLGNIIRPLMHIRHGFLIFRDPFALHALARRQTAAGQGRPPMERRLEGRCEATTQGGLTGCSHWRNRIECLYVFHVGEICIITAAYSAKSRKKLYEFKINKETKYNV